jgi:Cd(II)/Pb(II)-responsive transcriptional regulator
MGATMRISELAKHAGIKIGTIRYYEKAGLLPLPPRQPNGYRDYAMPHLERLAFIRHCRALDMSLMDIQQLLDFITHPNANCAAINQLVESQLRRVQGRIADLHTLESQLLMLRSQCQDQKTVAECGILKELVSAAHDKGRVCHQEVQNEHINRDDASNRGDDDAGNP